MRTSIARAVMARSKESESCAYVLSVRWSLCSSRSLVWLRASRIRPEFSPDRRKERANAPWLETEQTPAGPKRQGFPQEPRFGPGHERARCSAGVRGPVRAGRSRARCF